VSSRHALAGVLFGDGGIDHDREVVDDLFQQDLGCDLSLGHQPREVTFGEDPHEALVVPENSDRTNVVVGHQPGRFAHGF